MAAIRCLDPRHRQWETVAVAGEGASAAFVGVDRVAEDSKPNLPEPLRRERMSMVDASSFAR